MAKAIFCENLCAIWKMGIFQFSISIYQPSTSKLGLSTFFIHLDIGLIFGNTFCLGLQRLVEYEIMDF